MFDRTKLLNIGGGAVWLKDGDVQESYHEVELPPEPEPEPEPEEVFEETTPDDAA